MYDEALVVIDVQNDFCPGGTLAVADGDAVILPINKLIAKAKHVILTQDWHPVGHASFASSHANANPFSEIMMPYGHQTLWPDHCIRGTNGADFHHDLDTSTCELILRKGYDRDIDSYSAFFENDRTTPTGLAGYLKERNISKLTFCGLATDFCVAYSALDAIKCGFSASVVLSACRAIDLEGSLDTALDAMQKNGVELLLTA